MVFIRWYLVACFKKIILSIWASIFGMSVPLGKTRLHTKFKIYRSINALGPSEVLHLNYNRAIGPKTRFGNNFWLESPIDLRPTPLNCVLQDLFRDTLLDYIWRAQICIFGIFGGAKYGQVGCPWKDHIILVQTNLSCFSVTWEGNILLSLQLISPNSLSCVWWSSERWQTCKECYLEPRTRQEAKWARDRKWRFEQKRTQQCLWQKTYRKTFYKMKGKIIWNNSGKVMKQ